MASGTVAPTSRAGTWTPARLAVVAAVALLAYEALHFTWRDPLHYLLSHTPATFTDHYWPRRFALLAHIAGGLTALLTGPFQLWSGTRRWNLRLHRATGYAYIGGIALAGGAGFYLAAFATPRDFGVALAALAAAWWTCVGMALLAIRGRRIEAHRQWMIRGYVLTFAFVTFRFLNDLPYWSFLGDAAAGTLIWLCWVPPLLATEVVLQWRHSMARPQ